MSETKCLKVYYMSFNIKLDGVIKIAIVNE